jgi:hypothetical protein
MPRSLWTSLKLKRQHRCDCRVATDTPCVIRHHPRSGPVGFRNGCAIFWELPSRRPVSVSALAIEFRSEGT